MLPAIEQIICMVSSFVQKSPAALKQNLLLLIKRYGD